MPSPAEPYNSQESFTGNRRLMSCFKLSLLVLLALSQPGYGQQDQNATLESLLASAQKAQSDSDYATAASKYKQAVKIRPDVPELWANLGLMEHETGSYPEAIQSFQQAHKLKPSLYVPNLFLGIDFVHTGKAKEAIPFLLTAEKMNSADIQPHLALGRAYSSLQEFSLSAHEFAHVTHADPKQSSAWFSLGIAYLGQVEADARIMSERDHDSPYAKTLYAESLVNQARYTEAAEVYKSALTANTQIPCLHGELGFVYLKQHNNAAATAEFAAGRHSDSACALATLGEVRLHIDEGANEDGLRLLIQLWNSDPGFVRTHAPTLADGMTPERVSAFSTLLSQQHDALKVPDDLYRVLDSILQGTPSPEWTVEASPVKAPVATDVTEHDYASGHYRQCADQLMDSVDTKNQSRLQLLAACSFLTGDYELSSRAASALAVMNPQAPEALYWSIQANERLAFQALERYEQLEPHSERSHLLLGDIYVQRERYDDAESEYQKALDIAPGDPAALLGLASAYLRGSNIPKAVENAQLALQKLPDDPEVNLTMGEALMARHEFMDAEPYLKKALHAKPQMLPHVHALLGRVYAETDRTQEAIHELTIGLGSDEDGSVHYQLARLYRKNGDVKDASIAMEQMEAIQQGRREGAVIAWKDSHPSSLSDEPEQ
jgi:tetratricopeptide (TPR) repeat protein